MEKTYIFNETDKQIYEYLQKNKKATLEEIFQNIKTGQDNIRRSIEYLKMQEIIKEQTQNKEKYEVTNLGENAINGRLIEKIFCEKIKDKQISVSELNNINIPELTPSEKSIAFGICKNKELITIEDNKIKINKNFEKIINQTIEELKQIKQNKKIQQEKINEYIKRKFIIKKEETEKIYSLIQEIKYNVQQNEIIDLTSDLIKTKEYKNKKFKEYDVEILPAPAEIGGIHPLRQIINYIREIYLEMGFIEMTGPYVDVAFWPMDSMFISQDHPMRDIQDTFYLPQQGDLPNSKKLINTITKLHKDGWKTGSIGYKYNWNPELAKQLVLRPHTTSLSFRKFYELQNPKNTKYFSVGKVFRNETIDQSHLPEFHQAEGFVIGDDLSLADLMGFIKEFFYRLGIQKIKFKPTYNPYTEPSVECYAYFEKEKKWIELINAGIFRKEAIAPYGIKQNVIAWGLGIERVAMIIYQKSIKEIYGDECNLDWLRTYPLPKREIQ